MKAAETASGKAADDADAADTETATATAVVPPVGKAVSARSVSSAAKPDVSHYRRAYFALCRELGIEDDTRHALNKDLTGKASTHYFTIHDWKVVVAELQRRNGQDSQPGRPRLKHVAQPPSAVNAFDFATDAQAAAIEGLAERIIWRSADGAARFVRARILPPLRQARWDGQWEMLSRDEATKVIIAMTKMARRR